MRRSAVNSACLCLFFPWACVVKVEIFVSARTETRISANAPKPRFSETANFSEFIFVVPLNSQLLAKGWRRNTLTQPGWSDKKLWWRRWGKCVLLSSERDAGEEPDCKGG